MRLVPLVGQLSDHKLACAPPASTAGNLADSMLLTHRETLQRHIAARLREQHEEKDLLMEPVRSMLYFKTGMAIDQLVYLLTRQADAAKKGQSAPPPRLPQLSWAEARWSAGCCPLEALRRGRWSRQCCFHRSRRRSP